MMAAAGAALLVLPALYAGLMGWLRGGWQKEVESEKLRVGNDGVVDLNSQGGDVEAAGANNSLLSFNTQILTPTQPQFSVLIAARNEAANLGLLIGEIATALRGRYRFEAIIVDDGSDDETPAVLARIAEQSPEVRRNRHTRPCGQSAAIRSGVLAARGVVVATLDGDGQNDPSDLPKLVETLLGDRSGQLGLVIGWRKDRQDTGDHGREALQPDGKEQEDGCEDGGDQHPAGKALDDTPGDEPGKTRTRGASEPYALPSKIGSSRS